MGQTCRIEPWLFVHQAWIYFSSFLEAAKTSGDRAAMAAAARIEPFELLNPDNASQIALLQVAVGRMRPVLAQWLERCFRATSASAVKQLTASGHDLGSDLLFPQRLGFSGTPNELVPLSLL